MARARQDEKTEPGQAVSCRHPLGGQAGFAEPPLIQGQLQLAQILAGEFPWPPPPHGGEAGRSL